MNALEITATRSDGQPLAMYSGTVVRLLESHGFTVQRVDIDGTSVLGTIEDFAPIDIGLGDPLEAVPGGYIEPTPAPPRAGAPELGSRERYGRDCAPPLGPYEVCDGMGI